MNEMPVNRAERAPAMRAAVYLILRRQEEILLARRCNTGFQDGNYSLVAGHVEAGESVTAALIREAHEEAGIALSPETVQFIHLMHRKSEDNLTYFDFFFAADRWVGEITNCEPDKCDDLRWFPLNRLPLNLVSYVRDVLTQHGVYARPFSEYGWSVPEDRGDGVSSCHLVTSLIPTEGP